jgi:hypothetical protein
VGSLRKSPRQKFVTALGVAFAFFLIVTASFAFDAAAIARVAQNSKAYSEAWRLKFVRLRFNYRTYGSVPYIDRHF